MEENQKKRSFKFREVNQEETKKIETQEISDFYDHTTDDTVKFKKKLKKQKKKIKELERRVNTLSTKLNRIIQKEDLSDFTRITHNSYSTCNQMQLVKSLKISEKRYGK